MTRIMICGHRWTSHKGKASLTGCAITLAFQDTRLPPRPHHLFQLSLPRDEHGKLTTPANRAVCKEVLVDPASAVLHQWIRSLIGALAPDPVDAELNLLAKKGLPDLACFDGRRKAFWRGGLTGEELREALAISICSPCTGGYFGSCGIPRRRTDHAFCWEMTFGDLLGRATEAAPDRIALIVGVSDPALRRQWTYTQFYREAHRTARALLRRFKPGKRVAIWAQNIPEWVMLEFGAGMAGMVRVSVNSSFRAKEVEYVLKQSRSAGVFVVSGFRGNPMLETVQAIAPNSARSFASTIGTPSSPQAMMSQSRCHSSVPTIL
jgi:hypothetical protein